MKHYARHRIAAHGITLSAQTHGNPRHTPVVLVHGYPDNHRVWLPVTEHLARRYHVITYDVRGAGESDAPASIDDYTLPRLADDLAAVVDTLIPGRSFHLVGHDWGAVQSWESVTSGRLQSRIASFTSISGPCLDHMGYWLRDRLQSASLRDKRELIMQLGSSWYIALFQLPGIAPALWRAGIGRHWPRYLALREGVREALINPTQTRDGATGVNLYRANIRQRLLKPEPRHAHCPVQLIIPTQDNYVGAQLFGELERWVPALYRREIAASHWVPLSHPQQLADWIDAFVAHIEGNGNATNVARYRVTPARTTERFEN